MKSLSLSNIVIVGAKPIQGMRSFGPISNIPILGKKTVLDIQVQNLKKRFICDNIIYIGGYMCEKIATNTNKNQKISIINNEEYQIKNNGYSLKLASKHLDKYNSTLILFGKTLIKYKAFDEMIKEKCSSILVDSNKKNAYNIGYNIDKTKGLVNNLFYGLDNKICGIYLLKNEEHNNFKYLLQNKKNIDNTFIFEIINELIDMGGKFKPIEIDSSLVKQIDSSSSLKNTIRYYAKNFST